MENNSKQKQKEENKSTSQDEKKREAVNRRKKYHPHDSGVFSFPKKNSETTATTDSSPRTTPALNPKTTTE